MVTIVKFELPRVASTAFAKAVAAVGLFVNGAGKMASFEVVARDSAAAPPANTTRAPSARYAVNLPLTIETEYFCHPRSIVKPENRIPRLADS